MDSRAWNNFSSRGWTRSVSAASLILDFRISVRSLGLLPEASETSLDLRRGFPASPFERAFVWDAAGGTVDLNGLMGLEADESRQFPLAQAFDLNGLGQIVGYGPNGGWLLTPVPEPGGALLVLAALFTLGRRRRSRV